MGDAYPELLAAQAASAVTLTSEETKFLETLAIGSRQVQDAIEKARAAGHAGWKVKASSGSTTPSDCRSRSFVRSPKKSRSLWTKPGSRPR